MKVDVRRDETGARFIDIPMGCVGCELGGPHRNLDLYDLEVAVRNSTDHATYEWFYTCPNSGRVVMVADNGDKTLMLRSLRPTPIPAIGPDLEIDDGDGPAN